MAAQRSGGLVRTAQLSNGQAIHFVWRTHEHDTSSQERRRLLTKTEARRISVWTAITIDAARSRAEWMLLTWKSLSIGRFPKRGGPMPPICLTGSEGPRWLGRCVLIVRSRRTIDDAADDRGTTTDLIDLWGKKAPSSESCLTSTVLQQN